MKLYTHEQGTPEWLACRAGKITGSRCKDARDRLKPAKGETVGRFSSKATGYAAQVALERIARRPVDPGFQSWQMREGHEQEPFARMALESHTGYIVQEVGAMATDDDRFLYSPDGLVDDDGLIEIKTLLSPERVVSIVGAGDISDFRDQCLFGLWLTGRQWIDLAIWCPALEPIGRHLTIHHIERDEEEIAALETDLLEFLALVDQNESLLRGPR